mmetsp:Transcript_34530/g.77432  ORF Transcript_34530/g.77432 Transcript_34530/m.77432 type:complete len:237 (-) Transcript_34530:184-894(-)
MEHAIWLLLIMLSCVSQMQGCTARSAWKRLKSALSWQDLHYLQQACSSRKFWRSLTAPDRIPHGIILLAVERSFLPADTLAFAFALARLVVFIIVIGSLSLATPSSFPSSSALALSTAFAATASAATPEHVLGVELLHERIVQGWLVALVACVQGLLGELDLDHGDVADVCNLVQAFLQWLILVDDLNCFQLGDLVQALKAAFDDLRSSDCLGQSIASSLNNHVGLTELIENGGRT